MPLREISCKKKLRHINHDKVNHLANSSATMNELMDKFYEKTELSDVICEEYFKLSDK